MTYKYTVGTRVLKGQFGLLTSLMGNSLHVAILLGNDIFEYGVSDKDGETNDAKKTYKRYKIGDETDNFNWKNNFEIEGISKVSPDELESQIKKSNQWGPGTYNMSNHNCHDFVKFCCDIIEPDKTIMSVEVAPVAPFYENRLIRAW